MNDVIKNNIIKREELLSKKANRQKLTVEEELAEIFGKVLAGSPDVKSRMIKAFARLPDEAYPIVADLVERMAAEILTPENKETE